ncbi:MAG: hypothetical protein AB8G23_07875 [Myxococcota bacterium]
MLETQASKTAMLRILVAVLAAAVSVAAFGLYDVFVLEVGPLKEGPPQATPYHFLRGVCAFLAAGLIVAAILGAREERALRPVPRSSAADRWVIRGIAILSLTTLLIFGLDAEIFSQISSEDGVVEDLSALALLAAAAGLALVVARSLSAGDALKALAFAGLAAGCFVTGMEEISWGQRLVGFDSPEVFVKYNQQQEFNLHNLWSDLAENIYYVGAVGFLIVLPFLHDVVPLVGVDHPLAAVLPERKVIFASGLAAAYNWDMWRVVPIQLSFYLALLILGYYLIQAFRGDSRDRGLIMLVFFALLANQATFLIWGEHQSWTWATTEYKELFIPLGFLFYAASVLARERAARFQLRE